MTSNGHPSIRNLCARAWAYYKSSFTWRYVKTFWPVYLFWILWLSEPYAMFLAGLMLLAPSNNGLMEMRTFHLAHHCYKGLRLFLVIFLELLTLLFIPYYIRDKKNAIALQYGFYLSIMLLLYPTLSLLKILDYSELSSCSDLMRDPSTLIRIISNFFSEK